MANQVPEFQGKRWALWALLLVFFLSVLGCPFDDDDDMDPPRDDEIQVKVTLNATGEIADIEYNGRHYQIDITGQGGVLDPASIDILNVNQVTQNGFPPGFSFPDGLITFKVTGLNVGDTISAVLTFPSEFPAGSQYYKVTDDGWVLYANAVFAGNQVTITLTDGLDGDLDALQNGEILDPGAPGLIDYGIPHFTVYPDKMLVSGTEVDLSRKGGGPWVGHTWINTANSRVGWYVQTRQLPDWLSVWPESGTGSAYMHFYVCYSSSSLGTTWVNVPISDTGGYTRNVKVGVNKRDPENLNPPFGSFDTPLDNSTVRSSIPVTGWALDDVGVDSVKIYNTTGGGQIYIGDAAMVEGARPDVANQYPDYPQNSQAGWGYMMLTNFLPNGGNGTYIIEAVATDYEGNQTSLGSKTIICDNANAVKPFGALDAPVQGGTASGSSYANWGWALTPQPNSIPADGSTLNVYVDGVYQGHPTYDQYREDIANLFPGYANSDGAAGYFYLDTTAYTNGVHTIQWTARDNAGNSDGIGSRFFTINNTD
ncbi:hypothetical protein Dalk_0237 [Desulfatibacillum aliphaticivorans]|uniref:Uncharacterized protein n=1 Tax=Desulfatibacillum aliphaticivorans TaxID=218208 RepID=B8FMS9_DESAL|nr:choice-of-anchor U domain-containing protein [Desulfatibacillum aliphaticivorans]ACL01946.1 hypothetical protein Dalk_0237 [Desulfatibacillum aliphaticivorans]